MSSATLTAPLANPLLTPEQAAEYLGVQPQTLNLWRCTGRYSLPFIKCGRLVKYRRADLDAWLTSRTQTSSSAPAGR